MKRKIINYLVLIAIPVLTLVSCENSNNEVKARVAVILKDRNAFWEYVAEGILDAAEEENLEANIFYTKSDIDYATQVEVLKNLDPTQYAGIYISPACINNELRDAINNVSNRTSVVILETKIPGLQNTKYISMSSNEATGDLYHKSIVHSINKEEIIPEKQTAIIFDIKNSPGVNERVASYTENVETKGHTIIRKYVAPDGSDFEAKFNEAISELKGDEEFYYFSPNAIISNLLSRTLSKAEYSAYDRFTRAIDITPALLEKIRDDKAVAIAQDNYGYGYEGIKLLFSKNDILVLDPAFIYVENVDDKAYKGFLNGL